MAYKLPLWALSSAHFISFDPLRRIVSTPLVMFIAVSPSATVMAAFSRVNVFVAASKLTLPVIPAPVTLPPPSGTGMPFTVAFTTAAAAFRATMPVIQSIKRMQEINFFILFSPFYISFLLRYIIWNLTAGMLFF